MFRKLFSNWVAQNKPCRVFIRLEDIDSRPPVNSGVLCHLTLLASGSVLRLTRNDGFVFPSHEEAMDAIASTVIYYNQATPGGSLIPRYSKTDHTPWKTQDFIIQDVDNE